jgi:hypothetical protein
MGVGIAVGVGRRVVSWDGLSVGGDATEEDNEETPYDSGRLVVEEAGWKGTVV